MRTFLIFAALLALVFALLLLMGAFKPQVFPAEEKMRIWVGGAPVDAVVADTPEERVRGLSGTPELGSNEGMFFVFENDGFYRIWMKDMRYAIDILWIEEDGTIIHIEENVTPDTYPKQFTSRIPARYVLEVLAGFVEKHDIRLYEKAGLL
jgi:uncharacterized membrane protein (UPF0127 family)